VGTIPIAPTVSCPYCGQEIGRNRQEIGSK